MHAHRDALERTRHGTGRRVVRLDGHRRTRCQRGRRRTGDDQLSACLRRHGEHRHHHRQRKSVQHGLTRPYQGSISSTHVTRNPAANQHRWSSSSPQAAPGPATPPGRRLYTRDRSRVPDGPTGRSPVQNQRAHTNATRLVGLVGLEPTTKGFTCAPGFPGEWTISPPACREAIGCGTLSPVIKDTRTLSPSPQVVSAPSDGVPPAWLRIAGGRSRYGFPEFIPFISRLAIASAPLR